MFSLLFIFSCLDSASLEKSSNSEDGGYLRQKALASFLLSNCAGAISSNVVGTGLRSHHPRMSARWIEGGRAPTSSSQGTESGGTSPLAIFLSEDCIQHDMGPGHPESPERLRHLIDLAKGDWSQEFGNNLRIHEPTVDASFEQLRRVHTAEHLVQISTAFSAAAHGSPVSFDSGDTVAAVGTPFAALRAAGLAVAAVDEVLDPSSAHNRAFVMARPPGHHAEPDRAMGFCFFNNVMVGVAHAEEVYGLKRIAILDFDVHHGNGDEAMSATSAVRFYGSSHEVPNFPFTGTERNASDKMNHIVNVPLPQHSGSAQFRDAWLNEILPAMKDFAPEMVFISAGFDAHADDPLSTHQLTSSDFEWITQAIIEAAPQVPLVSCLEGGYDIWSLGESAHAHVEALVKTRVKRLAEQPRQSHSEVNPLAKHALARALAVAHSAGNKQKHKNVFTPLDTWWTQKATSISVGEIMGGSGVPGGLFGEAQSSNQSNKDSSETVQTPRDPWWSKKPSSISEGEMLDEGQSNIQPRKETTDGAGPERWWRKGARSYRSIKDVLSEGRSNNDLSRTETPHDNWWAKRPNSVSKGEVVGDDTLTNKPSTRRANEDDEEDPRWWIKKPGGTSLLQEEVHDRVVR